MQGDSSSLVAQCKLCDVRYTKQHGVLTRHAITETSTCPQFTYPYRPQTTLATLNDHISQM